MRFRHLLLPRFIASFAFAALFLATGVVAQEFSHRLEIFGEVGGSFFSGKTQPQIRVFLDEQGRLTFANTVASNSLTDSARFFAGLRFRFTQQEAIEVSYSVGPNNIFVREDPVLPGPSFLTVAGELDSSAHFISLNYVRYVRSRGVWRPFFTGGVGAAIFPNTVNPSKFAGNFGGGVDVPLQNRLSLRVEYRVYVFEQPVHVRTEGAARGIAYHHGPSLGLAFRF